MRTNAEKYNYYLGLLKEKSQPFIDSIFTNGRPEKFYAISGYKLTEYLITSIRYDFGLYNTDKPTREDVNKAQELSENTPGFIPDNIWINYKVTSGNGFLSGSEKLINILSKNTYAFTAEELSEELQRRKDLYEPKEGHVACSYCGKQNLPENTIYSKLIFRDWDGRKQFVNQKTKPYCKGMSCADYDQMAHEG